MTSSVIAFLLPHPDDEFAIFAWIDDALRRGHAVHCIWMTDGGYGGQDVTRRRVESEEILRRAGLAPASFHFIGQQHRFPDGELHNHIERAHDAVVELLAPLRGNISVLVPAWEGGHQDHDTTHVIGRALARSTQHHFLQYPIYQGEGLAGPMFRIMRPLASNGSTTVVPVSISRRLEYVRRCFGYRSQWKSFVGLLPFYALRMFNRFPFQLQHLQDARAGQRPHEGALLYERRGGPMHEEIIEAGRRLDRHLAGGGGHPS